MNDTTPEQNAKRVIELSEKATKGPWETDDQHCMVFLPVRNSEGRRYGIAAATDEMQFEAGHYSAFEHGSKDEPHANMDLIATYRTAAPELARAYLQAIQVIQSAPHEPDCQEMRQGMPLSALRNGVCKCWKAPFMKKHPNGL